MSGFNTGPIYGQSNVNRDAAGYPAQIIDYVNPDDSFVNDGSSAIVLYNNTIPAPANFDKLVTPIGSSDVIWQIYWDSAAITTAATTTGKLFLNPQTNAINGNLSQNGRLIGNEKYLITGVRVEVEADSTTTPLDAVDLKEILRTLYMRFWVLNKPYFDVKGMQFLNPEAPLLLNTNYYQQNPFMSFQLPIQMAIGANDSFYWEFTTTAPALSGNWRLFCYMQGALYRGVQ